MAEKKYHYAWCTDCKVLTSYRSLRLCGECGSRHLEDIIPEVEIVLQAAEIADKEAKIRRLRRKCQKLQRRLHNVGSR